MQRADLSSTLEETARASDGYGLIHHPLADTQVLVDPLRHLFVITRYAFGLETRYRVAAREAQVLENKLRRSCSCFASRILWTYVKPVDRFIPARKAETGREESVFGGGEHRNIGYESRTQDSVEGIMG